MACQHYLCHGALLLPSIACQPLVQVAHWSLLCKLLLHMHVCLAMLHACMTVEMQHAQLLVVVVAYNHMKPLTCMVFVGVVSMVSTVSRMSGCRSVRVRSSRASRDTVVPAVPDHPALPRLSRLPGLPRLPELPGRHVWPASLGAPGLKAHSHRGQHPSLRATIDFLCPHSAKGSYMFRIRKLLNMPQ